LVGSLCNGVVRRRGLAVGGPLGCDGWLPSVRRGLRYLYPFLGVARCRGTTPGIGGAWAPRLLLGALGYLDLFLGGECQFGGPNIFKFLPLDFFCRTGGFFGVLR
jgi:hypothetical protein